MFYTSMVEMKVLILVLLTVTRTSMAAVDLHCTVE